MDPDGPTLLDQSPYGCTSRQSLIMRLVPQLVESRIPRVASLRNSITRLRSSKDSDEIRLRSPSSPPSYHDPAQPHHSIFDGEEYISDMAYQTGFDMRPSSSRSSTLPSYQETESSSSINWRFATQGMALVTTAQQESSEITDLADEGAFTRRLFIHGLTYLLRGLPNDLTLEESSEIRYALPIGVADPLAVIPAAKGSRPGSSSSAGIRANGSPSIVHRILATCIVQFFVVFSLLVPYIKILVSHAYRLDRTHHISERMVRASINTVNEFGRAGIQFADNICRMNDGKVGQALHDMALWWIRGIAGGIHQGLDEGIDILGLPSPKPVAAG